jgi:hypothetical protein
MFGGSAGAGGYDFQSRTIAWVCVHILAKRPLPGIRLSRRTVPVSVATETGTAGDDLFVDLAGSDTSLDIQVKKGLTAGAVFHEVVDRFARGLTQNVSCHGVLVVDRNSSAVVREQLRKDLDRIRGGRRDGNHSLTVEVERRLGSLNAVSRFHIIELDVLREGAPHSALACQMLREILTDTAQAETTWETLIAEGHRLMSDRGRHTRLTLLTLLGARGVQLEDVQDATLSRLLPLGTVTSSPEGYIVQRCRSENGDLLGSALAYFRHWLSQSDSKLLIVLGDYGIGKTTLLQRISHEIVLHPSTPPRFPVYVELRRWAPGMTFWNAVGQCVNAKYTDQKGYDLADMNARGEIVLFLDAFDEIPDNVTEQELASHFDEILRYCTGQAKIVLSCRTHFFKSDGELRYFVRTPAHLGSLASQIAIIHLLDFDADDIATYAQNVLGKEASAFLKKLRAVHGLFELAHRPIILRMLLNVLPELDENSSPRIHEIYTRYTDGWFRSQAARGMLSYQSRKAFCEALADYLNEAKILSVDEGEIRRLLTGIGVAGVQPKDLEGGSADVRTVALIVRDSLGQYTFSHRSFQEFFFASKLSREIQSYLRGQTSVLPIRLSQSPLSDAEFLFLESLTSEYTREEVQSLVRLSATIPDERLSTNVVRLLLGLTPQQVPWLMESLDEDMQLNHSAAKNFAWALGELGRRLYSSDLRLGLKARLEKVFAQATNDFVLWNAAFALQKMYPELDAISMLESKIGVDWDADSILASLHSRTAVVAAARYGRREASAQWGELLLQLASIASDAMADVESRYHALRIIEQAVRAGVAPNHVRHRIHASVTSIATADDTLNYLQSIAVEALGAFRDPNDVPTLKLIIADSNGMYFRAKMHALKTLFQIEGTKSFDFMRQVMPLQLNPAVTEAIEQYLSSTDERTSLPT